MRFDELPLCDSVLDAVDAMNFDEATPVQEQTIPLLLQKRDIIACAQTGTGKTAAFILPLLHNLQTTPHRSDKINALIMAPTRELAQQIDQQMEGFSYFTPFSSVAVYGGNDAAAWEVQKRGLMMGAEVVVATPGRLISHINLYEIDFSDVQYFILDEADRMLDMGFFDDIMLIAKKLPKSRQTILFSATMPPKIRALAKTLLNNPAEVKIAVSKPPESIKQSCYICHENQKTVIIRHLFARQEPNKVLVFSGSKLKVKEIAKTFKAMGLKADAMHSDLEQADRDRVMHEFRNNRVNILVATDIVSRGIDIDDITMVINFDVPHDVEDYVHRIGRTARANAEGTAITFVSGKEHYKFKQIENFLGKPIEKIPLPPELSESPTGNPKENQPVRPHRNFGGRPAHKPADKSQGGKKILVKKKN
jgi:superfamily II DNA/RNA helicase